MQNNINELYHHGVPGQKWGVRRYQNADGSLTPEGRRKAEKLANKYAKITGKKLITRKGSVQANMPKSLKEMSNEEIIKKMKRKKLEDQYNRLFSEPVSQKRDNKQYKQSKSFVRSINKNILAPALIDAGKSVLTSFFIRKGNEAINPRKQSEYQKVIEQNKIKLAKNDPGYIGQKDYKSKVYNYNKRTISLKKDNTEKQINKTIQKSNKQSEKVANNTKKIINNISSDNPYEWHVVNNKKRKGISRAISNFISEID